MRHKAPLRNFLLLGLLLAILQLTASSVLHGACPPDNFCASDIGRDGVTAQPTFFEGLIQAGFSSVDVITGTSSAPIGGPGPSGLLSQGLQSMASNWASTCPTTPYPRIPSFQMNLGDTGNGGITELAIEYLPDVEPRLEGGRLILAEHLFEMGPGGDRNLIRVPGKCPSQAGFVLPCVGQPGDRKIDWSQPDSVSVLMHELGHSLGLGHDKTNGACSSGTGLMRADYAPGNALTAEHCGMADWKTCDSDVSGGENCSDPRPSFPVSGIVTGLKATDQATRQNKVTLGQITYPSPRTTFNGASGGVPFTYPVIDCANFEISVTDGPPCLSCPTVVGSVNGGAVGGQDIACTGCPFTSFEGAGAGLGGGGCTCQAPTVSVGFTNLLEGPVGVTLDADLPNGMSVEETITVQPSEMKPFDSLLPQGSTFTVEVTTQPPPPGEIFNETVCSLPAGTMTMETSDFLINGECENRMVGRPDICDVFPSLCVIIDTFPIEFTCLGGTLVYDYTVTLFVCEPNPQDPENPICVLTEVQGAIKRNFIFCEFNGPFFNGEFASFGDPLEGGSGPVEFEGPYTSVALPREDEVVSGETFVFGYLMDQGTGIDTVYFALDGQEIGLSDFQTGQDNEGLCAQLPSEFGPCLPDSLYSGLLDTRNLSDGPHVLEVVGVNNDDPQGFTLVTRTFFVDNGGGGGCGGDTTPPNVGLTAPPDGAILPAGVVSLTASASDANGIEEVSFFVDGIQQGSADSTAPYSQSWNATGGQHEIQARAEDQCGNVAWSAVHTVLIDGGGDCDIDVTGPSVSVTQPTAGSTHPAGSMILRADASDPSGVESVQFYIDGTVVAVDFSEPYNRSWNATEGNHEAQAGAIDECGNESLSEPVPFTVTPDPCDDDTTAPTVSITSPAQGAVLPVGLHTISADASDANGVEQVRFYVDGVLVFTDNMAPFAYNWNAQEGNHTLEARAYDSCGNVGAASVTVTVTDDPCATDVTGPSVSLTAPADGSVHDAGPVNLSADASDPNGVESVQFYVDGVQVAADFEEPWSRSWNATVGSHTLHAGAIDQCGNEAFSDPISVEITTADPCNSDTTAPTVSLTSPADGAELPIGIHPITATASDANGVQRVEFYVDGTLVFSDTSPPFSHNWNASLGGHTLQARAYDTCGNARWSSAVAVTVVSGDPCDFDTTGPSITMTAPTNGSTHEAGNVNVRADATDPNGVESVQFYVDGVIVAVDFASPFSRTWNATVGNHTLYAGGIDQCGNESQSAPITVTIVEPDPCAGDTTGPTISITEPENNSQHEPGTVNFRVNASDPGGVEKVEFYVDDVLRSTDTTAPYSWFWGDGSIGWHTIKARAFDDCGNSRWSATYNVELRRPDDPPVP